MSSQAQRSDARWRLVLCVFACHCDLFLCNSDVQTLWKMKQKSSYK
jgi:hypothetical protein